MTDKELLELAAKAAGMMGTCAEFQSPERLVFLPDGSSQEWNPLTGNDDAMRLAVKLGLDIFCRPAQWSECGRIGTAGHRELYKGDDPYAATRRAIVRAAAEIGRKM